MIIVSGRERDKALVAILYESGWNKLVIITTKKNFPY